MTDEVRRPRILLADDYVEMHRAMARLLAPACDVIGEVSDSTDLFAAIRELRPDVVVLDLNMPKMSGIEACRRIRATTPSVQVIVLTAADDPYLRKRAYQAGASGFVVKMRASDDLLTAIQDALAGAPPSANQDSV